MPRIDNDTPDTHIPGLIESGSAPGNERRLTEALGAAALAEVIREVSQNNKLIVVSNREPLIHEQFGRGSREVRPASGMVTGLEPIVLAAAEGDPDVHVLLLPADANRTIDALQRLADIVLQKSTREGFGLTVTEGMWKGKPVIGGDTGGIRLQVINFQTGFLVNSPEGAAHRIRFLLHNRQRMKEMGETARAYARDSFLLTRHLREYLTLILVLRFGNGKRLLYV